VCDDHKLGAELEPALLVLQPAPVQAMGARRRVWKLALHELAGRQADRHAGHSHAQSGPQTRQTRTHLPFRAARSHLSLKASKCLSFWSWHRASSSQCTCAGTATSQPCCPAGSQLGGVRAAACLLSPVCPGLKDFKKVVISTSRLRSAQCAPGARGMLCTCTVGSTSTGSAAGCAQHLRG